MLGRMTEKERCLRWAINTSWIRVEAIWDNSLLKAVFAPVAGTAFFFGKLGSGELMKFGSISDQKSKGIAALRHY